MSKIKLSKEFIKSTVKLALNEDLYPSGDITSDLINNEKVLTVKLISNQSAIVGGLLFAKQTFALILNLTRQGVSLIGYEQTREPGKENSRQVAI